MNLFSVNKRRFSFLVLYGAIIIGVGWFLWHDANLSGDSRSTGYLDKQYETSGSGPVLKNDSPPRFGVVTDVVDGMTIVIDKSYTVRYLGISVPATSDRVECFGKEALQANESMVGKTVRLEEDPVLLQAKDGAWLRYVWVADDEKTVQAYAQALSGKAVLGLTEPLKDDVVSGEAITPEENVDSIDSNQEIDNKMGDEPAATADELNKADNKASNDGSGKAAEEAGILAGTKDQPAPEVLRGEAGEESPDMGDSENKFKEYIVSERIIEMGLGFPLLAKEMVQYEKLSSAARYSSATKRGLWGKCEISQGDSGLLQTQTVEECNIKGVQVISGEKVYRVPSCSAYKDTMVRLYKDNEWLCSEEEATSKGYVRAVDCE